MKRDVHTVKNKSLEKQRGYQVREDTAEMFPKYSYPEHLNMGIKIMN